MPLAVLCVKKDAGTINVLTPLSCMCLNYLIYVLIIIITVSYYNVLNAYFFCAESTKLNFSLLRGYRGNVLLQMQA